MMFPSGNRSKLCISAGRLEYQPIMFASELAKMGSRLAGVSPVYLVGRNGAHLRIVNKGVMRAEKDVCARRLDVMWRREDEGTCF
jgi:hypothetical protein